MQANVIPKNARRFIAFDYGFDMLAVLLISVDKNGTLYVERELCVQNLTLSRAGEAIAKFVAGSNVEYAVASPDLWNRRQDSGKSGVEIMQSVFGMPRMIPADDRRVAGWRVLKDHLSPQGSKPTLFICNNCCELIHSMQSLLCDKNRIDDASSEPHAVTHAPEALRYAVMSRVGFIEEKKEPLPFKFRSSKNEFDSFWNY